MSITTTVHSKIPVIIRFLLIAEVVNNIFTTTVFNSYTTTIDIVLFTMLLLIELPAIGNMKISPKVVFGLLIFIALLIKSMFASDILRAIQQSASLFVQVVLVFYVPSIILNSQMNDSNEFYVKMVKACKFVVSILLLTNILLMLYGKITNSFVVGDVVIGDPISGMFYGLFKTPAFSAAIANANLFLCFATNKKHNTTIRCYGIMMVLATYYYSGSRAGLIAVIAFILVFLILTIRKTQNRKAAVLLIVLLIVIMLPITMNLLAGRADEISSSRVSVWIYILNNEISIWGTDGLEPNVEIAGRQLYGGAHNAYIQLLYNTGPIITIAFLSFLVQIILPLRRKIATIDNPFLKVQDIALFSGIISICVFSIFESHLFFLRSTNSIFFWLFLLLININKSSRKGKTYENTHNIC